MKIGITGSRDGISQLAINTLKEQLRISNISEVHHGDCVGADQTIHEIISSLPSDGKIKIVIHPPNNNSLRAYCDSSYILPPKPYLDRNHDIVDCTDQLFAFPSTKQEIMRSGTWSTVRYAKKIYKPITMIYPDGTTESIS